MAALRGPAGASADEAEFDLVASIFSFGGNGEISRSQNLEHPFEVLIDDDSHHLDLYRELLQFRAEMLAERTALSRSGR